MIKVRIKSDYVEVSGHAGYAPSGFDIVCSAMSALFIMLCELLKQSHSVAIIEKEGYARVSIDDPDGLSYSALQAFGSSVLALKNEFSGYVELGP